MAVTTQRKKGGRPPAKPDELRDTTITIAVSAAEVAALKARAGKVPLRVFIRLAALGRKASTSHAPPAAAFALAERLTAIAGDLAALAQATRSGRVLGTPAHLAEALHDAAHVAALLMIGARPDAR